MSGVRLWLSRVAGFILGRGADRDLNDELQFHLEMTEQQLRKSGMQPNAAQREARLRLGGLTQIGEAYADQRTLPRLESWIQDTKFGIRMLMRSPGFAVAVLLTLGLGIGANTAIFSIVHAVLLRPLHSANPTGSLSSAIVQTTEAPTIWDLRRFVISENETGRSRRWR